MVPETKHVVGILGGGQLAPRALHSSFFCASFGEYLKTSAEEAENHHPLALPSNTDL